MACTHGWCVRTGGVYAWVVCVYAWVMCVFIVLHPSGVYARVVCVGTGGVCTHGWCVHARVVCVRTGGVCVFVVLCSKWRNGNRHVDLTDLHWTKLRRNGHTDDIGGNLHTR